MKLQTQGFLLLEAFLALLILSLVVASSVAAIAQALHVAKVSKETEGRVLEEENQLFQKEVLELEA